MRYKQHASEDTEYLIFLDGEDERNVIRAIAIATFELAKPDSPDSVDYHRFKKNDVMTPKFADKGIDIESFCVLIMGVVRGRSCHVEIFRMPQEENVFRFCCYSKDLDKPAILERAKEILASL